MKGSNVTDKATRKDAHGHPVGNQDRTKRGLGITVKALNKQKRDDAAADRKQGKRK